MVRHAGRIGRRRRLLVAGGAIALLTGVAAWWWSSGPDTPAGLFRERCSACHERPDLSGYATDTLDDIVRTMRERNGADAVITSEEARTIIEYLKRRREAERNGE